MPKQRRNKEIKGLFHKEGLFFLLRRIHTSSKKMDVENVAKRDLKADRPIKQEAKDVKLEDMASVANNKTFKSEYAPLLEWLGNSQDATRAVLSASHAIQKIAKKHGVKITEDTSMALIDRMFAAAGPTPEQVISRFAEREGKGPTMSKIDFLRIFHGMRKGKGKRTIMCQKKKKTIVHCGNDQKKVNGLLNLPRNQIFSAMLDRIKGKKTRYTFLKSEGYVMGKGGNVLIPRRTMIDILEKYYGTTRVNDMLQFFSQNYGSAFEDEDVKKFHDGVVGLINQQYEFMTL